MRLVTKTADYHVSLAAQARRWRRRLRHLASSAETEWLPDGTLKCKNCGGEWKRDGKPDHFTDCPVAVASGLSAFLAQAAKALQRAQGGGEK